MSSSPPLVVADRYRLVAPLGQGGMGRVWRATDVVLHRDVAIKELVPPPGLTPDERREMRERSLREARAIARLNNINVVRVFDVLRTDADPWIVMEYVPSRSLQDILASDGPFPPVRAAEIGLGVLNALRAAHRAGVVHRDVKPGNVLIGGDGRVVLTDFGLATVPGDPNVTRTGLVLGSPAYISPERARDGTAGPGADLWSLGATLYAAVEGASPFARPSAIATLAALATENPPPARNAGPLKPVLNGLLRKDPTHRINADEAERLLLRATGRRSKLTFPMSPTMRRPGVGRERPTLPPLVPGAPPVVPGPRPPVSRPPVTPARPAQPASEGRPVFAPGKASVGRRPADTPTRVDGPKVEALDATRIDAPPVKDKPAGGTGTAPSSGTQTPEKPASGPAPGATMRGSRVFGGFTADEVAAHRGRPATGRAATPEAPAAPAAGTSAPSAAPAAGTSAAPAGPAAGTSAPSAAPAAGKPATGPRAPDQRLDVAPAPPAQTERPGDRRVTVPAARPGVAGKDKETGSEAAPAVEPDEAETAVPASGQPASASSGPAAPAEAASAPAADAPSAPAADASSEVSDSAAEVSSAASVPAVETPESAVSARPSQQRRQGAQESQPPDEGPATAASEGRSDASGAATEAGSTSAPSGTTRTDGPVNAEGRTPEAALAEAAETRGSDDGARSGVQADAAPADATGATALAAATESSAGGGQSADAAPADATESSAGGGQSGATAPEKSPASSATRSRSKTPASRSKSPATAPEAGAAAPVRSDTGDSAAAEAAGDPAAGAAEASGDPQSDDTMTVRRTKPAVGARAGTTGSKASRKKGRGRTAAATGAASRTGPAEPATDTPALGAPSTGPEATSPTGPEAGSEPATEAASETGSEAATRPENATGTEVSARLETTAQSGAAGTPGEQESADGIETAGNAGSETAAGQETAPESKTASGSPTAPEPEAATTIGSDGAAGTTAQAKPPKPDGATTNDTTKISVPRRTAPKATPARPAVRKTAASAAAVTAPATAAKPAAATRPDPTRADGNAGPAGAGPLSSGFAAGSARPAWQPMSLKPPTRGGGKGLTVFGTTLTKQQTVIGAAILVAVVLALVLIVPKAFGGGSDDDNKGQKAGSVPAASATGKPTTSAPATTTPTSAAPTSAAQSASAPAGNGAVTLPSGWHLYADSSGFKVPVPANWSVSHRGTETYFTEQGGQHRLLIVDQTTHPASDPVADWTGLESDRRGRYGNYHRVSIKAVDYWDKAADWEYTYTSSSGNPLHVRKRGFITAKNQAYGITWSISEKDWAANLNNLGLIYQGFVPARS